MKICIIITLILLSSCRSKSAGSVEVSGTNSNSSTNEQNKKEDSSGPSNSISADLIKSVSSDLNKVSGVIEDLYNFEPLEKEIAPLSYRSNLRALSKFLNKDSEASQFFYQNLKKDNQNNINLFKLNIASKELLPLRQFSFSEKINKVISTNTGVIFIYLSSGMVKTIKDGEIRDIKIDNGDIRKFKTYKDSLCFIDENESRASILSGDKIISASFKGSVEKIICHENELLLEVENQAILINNESTLKTISLESCPSKRYYVRNNGIILSCKEIGKRRQFSYVTNFEEKVPLPLKETNISKRYVTRVVNNNLDESERTRILILDKENHSVEEVSIYLDLKSNRIKFLSKENGYEFSSNRKIIAFDSEFEFSKSFKLPYSPIFKHDNLFYTRNLAGYKVPNDFDEKRFHFDRKSYISELKEVLEEEGFRAKKIFRNSQNLFFEENNNLSKLSFNDLSSEILAPVLKSSRMTNSVNGVSIVNERTLTFVDNKGEKSVIELEDELSKRSKVIRSFLGDFISYNGRTIASISSSGRRNNEFELKHFRKIIPLETGNQLLVSKGGEKLESMNILLLNSNTNFSIKKIDSIDLAMNSIRGFDLIDNFLVFYKKDNSLVIKKVNRSKILMEKSNEE